MAWTEQMIEDLKRMWDEGLSTGEIGKRLGVTKNSIIGKVHRLQLTARPSPIKKKEDGASSTPKAKETKATKPAPSSKQASAPKASAPSTPKATPQEAPKAPKEEPDVAQIPAKEENEEISPKLDRIETIRNSVHVEHPKGKHKTMLTDLDNHTCRWPIGDPKDENFHFCGRKVKIGQTYCEEHAAIAYVKANSKK